MSRDSFFENPVLNSPYEPPKRYWKLDEKGHPTGEIADGRRQAEYVSPVPAAHAAPVGEDFLDLKTSEYEKVYKFIDDIRNEVAIWRAKPESEWGVTPETARLLHYWREHKFMRVRPFFCQIEAVEILIWLTEVAPQRKEKNYLELIREGNAKANPLIFRIALKLATGAGKTTVMAMIIAWQAVNAARHPNSEKFSRAFLIIAPGLTIRDRLRVLNPADPDEYYLSRELIPTDLKPELCKAKIIITNYHAFERRVRVELPTIAKKLLVGCHTDSAPIVEPETEGEMLARVASELLSEKKILVINDEAHHCYRERIKTDAEPDSATDTKEKLSGDERKEANDRNEAARVWISGIEALVRRGKKVSVVDLSATPFFLKGSGYREGTLFPWCVSDFSIMDAIECGIVKLPRVPVTDSSRDEFPIFRDLWEHVKKDLPRGNAKKVTTGTPDDLPPKLINAINALYSKYEETFAAWEAAKIPYPPCFIFVCQNTAISKLVYDYVSGWKKDGAALPVPGKCRLFNNFDEYGKALDRPNTILVDSVQLENGEISNEFKVAAKEELAAFKRDIIERTGNREVEISDAEILREVMNTVGKEGRLGGNVRCVVSVSMLTEGWDANNVTHILGLRAFGTQLLCEQVVGRALRRSNYDLDDNGLFPAEYADIFGVPFRFIGKSSVVTPKPPKPVTLVRALSPERDFAEISFPNVSGYAKKFPAGTLSAKFDPRAHSFALTSDIVGPMQTTLAPIVGKTEDVSDDDLKKIRPKQIAYRLAWHLLSKYFRDSDDNIEVYRFLHVKKIVEQWLGSCLRCVEGCVPAQLLYAPIADEVCKIIHGAIRDGTTGDASVSVVLNPYTPSGSTRYVNFPTTIARDELFETSPKNHVNYAVLDSEMERKMCRIFEKCLDVKFWTRNYNLGFEIPYTFEGKSHVYIPDFIAVLTDGTRLIVETKGYDAPEERAKFAVVTDFWIPGVNARSATFGRWAFEKFGPYSDFSDAADMENEFRSRVSEILQKNQ